jgi:2-succinyl-5-enolpyruvyl-6-hydroxy-3-cyclohexene-1-carboxylate synthase
LATDKLPAPDVVVTVGTVGLSRSVLGILKATKQHIAVQLPSASNVHADPALTASLIVDALPDVTSAVDAAWLALWQSADAQAAQIVQRMLSGQTLSGPLAALLVWNHAQDDDQLMVAASWSVRHLEAYAPTRTGLRTFGNRGANGIDGLISTAWGVATCGAKRTYLLIGDVAFLHDIGGLNVADSARPNLTIVVLDNDGSGIFSQLEQAQPAYRSHYERIFGTPHGQDLWVIAEAFGYATTRVTTAHELERTLDRTHDIPGVHVIVCSTGTRDDEAQLISRIMHALKDSL